MNPASPVLRRIILVLALACLAAAASAERILLVPLDSRPAAGQFAQMIARMANVDVRLPEYSTLGRFTTPGSPTAILRWLENQDYRDVKAVVVSADMIAYGGLIASRTDTTSKKVAMERLAKLAAIRAAHPEVKFYVFSSIMRLIPTATKTTEAWRSNLGRYEELKSRYLTDKNPAFLAEMDQLQKAVPPVQIKTYEQTRSRDFQVNGELIRMVAEGDFDYLAFGQDDARLYGPHVSETARLKQVAIEKDVEGQVYFCEGIDQHSNVLLSRALMKLNDWKPKIKIVYSDDQGRFQYANFECKTIERSLRDQIVASGAEPAQENGPYDYALYVNTPGRRPEEFAQFLDELKNEMDQGFPVAVADINLANDGTADPQLFTYLSKDDRMTKLLSFAGWNTAGNTMGTAIPAANIYLLSRRLNVDPLERELARREFLLHRFVNDYAYHKFVRPQAYQMIDASHTSSREETYGETFKEVNDFVRTDVYRYLEYYFHEEFEGKRFFAGTTEYELSGLSNIKIFLPWPRAYEVRLEFQLHAEPVAAAEGSPPPTGSRR
ncbi:MAG TPA: DUF4127 family protein [Fimbriimonadaceae bacterium]|nr:DUF4127 family protein [Fimbriimonadaceae bacterium]